MFHKIIECKDGIVTIPKEELEKILDDAYDEGFNIGYKEGKAAKECFMPKEPNIANPPYSPSPYTPSGPNWFDPDWYKNGPTCRPKDLSTIVTSDTGSKSDWLQTQLTSSDRDWLATKLSDSDQEWLQEIKGIKDTDCKESGK